MPSIVRTDFGYEEYEVSLKGNEKEGFIWNIVLSHIVDEEKDRVYRVQNRGWRRVGPEFETRRQGSHFLGYDTTSPKGDVSANWQALIKEYTSLYRDEVETIDNISFEGRKFGRPSQGRTERLQLFVTPELKAWVQSQSEGKESLSQTAFRLLEGIRK